MGIYNCQADFHPFVYRYISQFISSLLFFFSTLLFLLLCIELRFYHLIILKKAFSDEENFVYTQNIKTQNLQQFLGFYQQDRSRRRSKIIPTN